MSVSDFPPLLVGLNITLVVHWPPAAIAKPALQVLDAPTIEKFVPLLNDIEVNVTVGFPAGFETVTVLVLLCPTLVGLKLSEVGDTLSAPEGVGVEVGVLVGDGVLVCLGVLVGVAVLVGVGVGTGVGVAVGVGAPVKALAKAFMSTLPHPVTSS